MLPAMLAEMLEVPALTNLESVTIEAERVSGIRVSDDATMQVATALPAVISVTEQLPEARFPNFKGIMAAKKKPLTVKNLGELDIDPTDMSASRAIMTAIAQQPPRAAGAKMTDDGTAVQQLVDFLTENRLV